MLDLRLLVTLHFAAPFRRLEVAKQGVIAALRVEVVSDDEEMAAVEHELSSQRLAARVECRVGRIDAARTIEQSRTRAAAYHRVGCGRTGAGMVDEAQAAVGAEEEALADVAAGGA